MRKIRICFPFAGDVIGGSHISALGLLQNLDRTRFEPVIVVQNGKGALARFIEQADLPIEEAPATPMLAHGRRPSCGQMMRILQSQPRLVRELDRLNIDIVHTNDGRTHATWALAARLAGCKLVWHHRGDPTAFGLRFAAPVLANATISVSKFALERSRFLKAHVIHSPFDVDCRPDRDVCRSKLIKEIGCDPSTGLIGYFGLLTARKRPYLFVDALAAMRDLMPDRPILGLIFGEACDFGFEELLEHARKKNVADLIHIMGFRKPGMEWIAACDLLMVPAINEPFGRTLIEAMLVGTPVVATRSGGNIEALRDGELGILVNPEDANALAAACAELLRDPARWMRLSTAAQLDTRARFGNARHAEAVMRIYEGILD